MNPDKTLMVVCAGEVLIAAACNAASVDDVAAAIGVAAMEDVVVVVGAVAAVAIWVQWCLMRPCTSP